MRRLVGVVTLLIGAALTLVGTFLPLCTQSFDVATDRMVFTQTAWGVTTNAQELYAREPRFGVPMVVAVALVVLGALMSTRMWGRLVAIAGAMLLTGAVWQAGQYVAALMEEVFTGLPITTELGLGCATLAAAVLVVVVGALLVQDWPPRRSRPDTGEVVVYRLDDEDTDTETPAFGFPAVPEERTP